MLLPFDTFDLLTALCYLFTSVFLSACIQDTYYLEVFAPYSVLLVSVHRLAGSPALPTGQKSSRLSTETLNNSASPVKQDSSQPPIHLLRSC